MYELVDSLYTIVRQMGLYKCILNSHYGIRNFFFYSRIHELEIKLDSYVNSKVFVIFYFRVTFSILCIFRFLKKVIQILLMFLNTGPYYIIIKILLVIYTDWWPL